MTETETMAWLARDPLLHVNITEALRLGRAKIIEARPAGVAVDMGGWLALISALDGETAFDLYALARERGVGGQELMLQQAEFAGPIKAAWGMRQVMEVRQVAKFDGVPLPVPDCGAEARVLGPEHQAFVCAHYDSEEEYIAERLAGGMLTGAFVGGELVAFAGEHDEGALGFLFVLPEYRRRHLGQFLSAVMVNRYLEEGRIPFGQVETHNTASLAMQRAAGFEVHSQKMVWLMADGPEK